MGRPEEAIEHWVAAVAAVDALGEEELVGTDVHRVRNMTPKKVDAVHAGEEPQVARLAAPVPAQDFDAEADQTERP